jgi:hypothetical protein
MRRYRDVGLVRDVDPDVHVRVAAEIPDKGRAFDPPVVPFTFLAQRVFLVEDQVALVEAALLLQTFQHRVLIRRAIRLQQAPQDLVHRFFLVAAHVADG